MWTRYRMLTSVHLPSVEFWVPFNKTEKASTVCSLTTASSSWRSVITTDHKRRCTPSERKIHCLSTVKLFISLYLPLGYVSTQPPSLIHNLLCNVSFYYVQHKHTNAYIRYYIRYYKNLRHGTTLTLLTIFIKLMF